MTAHYDPELRRLVCGSVKRGVSTIEASEVCAALYAALADAKMQLDVAASRYVEFAPAADRAADALRKGRVTK